jgi:hypothetical protein
MGRFGIRAVFGVETDHLINCLGTSVDGDPRTALRMNPLNMDPAEIGCRLRNARVRVNGTRVHGPGLRGRSPEAQLLRRSGCLIVNGCARDLLQLIGAS